MDVGVIGVTAEELSGDFRSAFIDCVVYFPYSSADDSQIVGLKHQLVTCTLLSGCKVSLDNWIQSTIKTRGSPEKGGGETYPVHHAYDVIVDEAENRMFGPAF